jgi:peptidoglycan/xylan/chitin deacetylase (PgdA/CDA1 family)
MSIAKKIYYQTIQLANLSLLKQLYPNPLLLPYHHLVSDEVVPHIKHLYPYKGVAAFKKDLDYLLKHFKPITLQEIITCMRNGVSLPRNSFLLTFDDGLKEVAEVIAPLLIQKGVPAAFFLNSAFLDNQSLFYKFRISLLINSLQEQPHSAATLAAVGAALHCPTAASKEELIVAIKRITYSGREITTVLGNLLGISFEAYLAQQRPFLTSDQVRTLIGQGFAIGGHSIDHPYYEELSVSEMLVQTQGSVDFLVDKFGLTYKAFAFPHTDAGIPREFFDRLLNGPVPALDIIFGTNNHREDIYPQILHRFNCERPGINIEAAVKGILLYNFLHKKRGTSIIHRQ